MRRWLIVALAAIPILLLGGDWLLWLAGTIQLQRGADEWLGARRAAGWTASVRRATERGGWPFDATLTLQDVALSGQEPDVPGGLDWRGDRVTLHASLFEPDQLKIDVGGAQHLRLSTLPAVAYKADRFEARLPLEPGVPPHSVTLVATNLRAGVGPETTTPLAITVDRLTTSLEWKLGAPVGEAALSISVNAQEIGLPMSRTWPLGSRIVTAALTCAVDGPIPRTPGLRARAMGWRDGGGTLEVQSFDSVWGPMTVSGTATLALDQDLQPLGTGTARVVGYSEALDALAAGGTISRQRALAAKAVLSLIASAPDDGTGETVEVPLTLRDHTLSMRQLPLARVPDLQWPG